ncbi:MULTISPECIES: K(+)-transporting ATPase subunit F [Paenibacillus]|uniref:K(+)-transporting ATPase subunit F n=2 Tax=Paenibacillus TaxID=44249 RepID=A0AAP7A617_PAEAL|nr:K(+)-transporting ATPase subunit F [Paenibacillus alvei]NOJ73618.1 K(+)-transporting ATPase subunit F [Paenibacillus alvei]OBY79140.1 K+-transporting ATPase subunit F [Paenibacillus sp. KS1]TQR42289.1 K(+)-transporting ATPase subunit F [Paenibacillus sp. SDF0028]
MMIVLFTLITALFIYLLYALVKPERF